MKIATKPLIVGGILGTAGLVALGGISTVSAHSESNSMSNIVETIATKFNLNKDEVQEVFDEEREARKEAFETQRTMRLQALVDAGTITIEQKAAIEIKLAQMETEQEANKDSMKELSESKRKAMMEERRAELETWAKENGIVLKDLRGIFRGPGNGHHATLHMNHDVEQ